MILRYVLGPLNVPPNGAEINNNIWRFLLAVDRIMTNILNVTNIFNICETKHSFVMQREQELCIDVYHDTEDC